MIVVIGRPAIAEGPMGTVAAGLASAVALAAAAAGSRVELVGTVGDDAAGDRVAVGLARAGVGHAALLRIPATATPRVGTPDPGTRLDAADIELGLRYLGDFRVVVVADVLPAEAAAVAAEAAEYAGAAVVVIVSLGDQAPVGFDPSATVIEAPAEGNGPFAVAVGGYAAALEAGEDPERALRGAIEAAGWEPVA